MRASAGLLSFVSAAYTQQIYLDTNLGPNESRCSVQPNYTAPAYSFSTFAYTQNATRRTATSVARPTSTTTYAPPYEELSTLLPPIVTTTWGRWDPADIKATDTADLYGQAAWSALWERANLTNFTSRGIYSNTVSPTPIPTSELILPPQDPFVPTDCYTFPEDFVMGVAGSAIQIEGATADEGRGPSFGDKFVGPEFVLEMTGQSAEDRSPSYVTNENYYLYKQDIERLAAIGVPYYSFSIAWTRILPFTLPNTPINKLGLQHYDDLINFVLEKGMKPIVTLTHIDSPLAFYSNTSTSYVSRRNEYGFLDYGMQNDMFEDAWVNYGKIVMSHFADRVPIWVTCVFYSTCATTITNVNCSINEPITGVDRGASVYHVLRGLARLYHFYHDEIQGKGRVGLKFNDNFGVPLDPHNSSDVEAAIQFNNAEIGVLANPIFLGKDYPEVFKLSLPDYVPLTPEDLAYMNGTADYFAIDAYTATVITAPPGGIKQCASQGSSNPLYPTCVIQSSIDSNGWNIGYHSQTFVYTTPTYLRSYLNWAWNTYKKPVIVSEFGFTVNKETSLPLPDALYDSPRSQYYLSFLQAMLQAIWEDHVHVLGALAWSFADNWEFGDFDSPYGLQYVNRTSQERRYKKSFFDMMDYYHTRKVCGN